MTMKKVERINGWRCNYCGEIYPTKEEAEQCWERHTRFVFQPVFELGKEFPTEVLIKKIEGNYYTEIGTYELTHLERVKIRVKESGFRKEEEVRRGNQ